MKIYKTIFCLLFMVFCISCLDRQKIDLSSPEATINTYCSSTNLEIIQECFYPREKVEKTMTKKIWSDYKIIEKKQTGMVGQELVIGSNINTIITEFDTEIIVEAKMIHPEKGNPWTKFWYILRNFNGEWKIISHYHIPDDNYPAYD